MKNYISGCALVAVLTITSSASAAVYTWTGAVDGDWNNNGNWAGGVAPVAATDPNSFSVGGQLSFPRGTSNRLVFDASGSANPVPTSNLPSFGGGNNTNGATPQIDLLFGTLLINKGAAEFWNQNTAINFATVGDGDTGNGLASLTYDTAGKFARSATTTNGAHTFIVNADGQLNFINPPSARFDWADGNRPAHIIINGGSVDIDGYIFDASHISTNLHFVDLTALGSTFTANFGTDGDANADDFANLSEVQAQLGGNVTDKFFRSSTGLTLQAVDNQDGSYTVSIVPEPSSLALLGLGGLLIARRRRG